MQIGHIGLVLRGGPDRPIHPRPTDWPPGRPTTDRAADRLTAKLTARPPDRANARPPAQRTDRPAARPPDRPADHGPENSTPRNANERLDRLPEFGRTRPKLCQILCIRV